MSIFTIPECRMKNLIKTALVLLILFISATEIRSQNNLNLQFNDGSSFRVFINDTLYNRHSQSQVLITGLRQDTVRLKVEVSAGERYGLTFYLLNKGKTTSGREFSYVLKKEKQRLKAVFLGMYDIR